jgi:glycosyltransferase involved in cell wall biosynthesis
MITSRYEGLALVSFEAMAVGTPQISADVGGQSELVTPDVGILIRTGIGEVDRFANACIQLLYDHQRRESMSAASRQKFTKQYTAENCAKEYSQVFEELSELSRRRADELSCLRPPHINPLNAFG